MTRAEEAVDTTAMDAKAAAAKDTTAAGELAADTKETAAWAVLCPSSVAHLRLIGLP